MRSTADSSASATRSPGRVDRSVATFAWSIPFSPTPELDSRGTGRREAGCSRAYCTESRRYCDGRCSPSVPDVPPFLADMVRARQRAARLERPPIPLLIPLPWKLPPGTTAHKTRVTGIQNLFQDFKKLESFSRTFLASFLCTGTITFYLPH